MCLNRTSEVKTATNPIVGFKTGDPRIPLFGQFSSLFQCFKYRRYAIQEEIDIVGDNNDGYGVDMEIERGYHSFKKFGLQVFIIPKGAKYFEGKHNGNQKGYASSNIVWIGSVFNPFTWIITGLVKIGAMKLEVNKESNLQTA